MTDPVPMSDLIVDGVSYPGGTILVKEGPGGGYWDIEITISDPTVLALLRKRQASPWTIGPCKNPDTSTVTFTNCLMQVDEAAGRITGRGQKKP